jgi:GNAT superfamily N-acetyltransferase
MDRSLTISAEEGMDDDLTFLAASLRTFNRKHASRPEAQHLCFMLRDAEGTLHGGIVGEVSFDVLSVDKLWINEESRGGDYGTQLMKLVEDEGRKLGARISWLDTYSWQARPFYEKLGYKVFAELPYAGGKHVRYFLRKDL